MPITLKTILPNVTAKKMLGKVWLRGKPWSIDEERRLRQLIEDGKGFTDISQVMGKSRVSIKNKLYNLGLSLKDNTQPQIPIVVSSPSPLSSKATIANPTPAVMPLNINEGALELRAIGPLPSIEEKLRVLDAAQVEMERPGLGASEISRLHNIVQGVKVYQQLFADYVNYRTLESEVLELRKQSLRQKETKSQDGPEIQVHGSSNLIQTLLRVTLLMSSV